MITEKEMRQYNTEKNTDEVMWLVSAVVKTYTCYKFNSVQPKNIIYLRGGQLPTRSCIGLFSWHTFYLLCQEPDEEMMFSFFW